MSRARKGNAINGWINLDKPEGMSSTQAIGAVRRALNAKKLGHAGTLDPLATGVLPIALGEATKVISYCQDHEKKYKFAIIWGEQRDTDDAEGKVINTSDHRPSSHDIEEIIPKFTGQIEQIPPQFSAIKVNGKRAYDKARAGEAVSLKPRTVNIASLELLDNNQDKACFSCICGKGTYMRSLARDIAKELGSAGYIAELRREAVGPFTADHAISLAKIEKISDIAALEESVLLPVETVLDDIPALPLKEQEVLRLRNGQKLEFISRPDVDRIQKAGIDIKAETTALAVFQNKPIALVCIEGVHIQPVRVLNL